MTVYSAVIITPISFIIVLREITRTRAMGSSIQYVTPEGVREGVTVCDRRRESKSM